MCKVNCKSGYNDAIAAVTKLLNEESVRIQSVLPANDDQTLLGQPQFCLGQNYLLQRLTDKLNSLLSPSQE